MLFVNMICFCQISIDSLECRSDSIVYIKEGSNIIYSGKCKGYVLKRDNTRNIGWSYSFMGRYEKLYIEGEYVNGKVDGIWTYKSVDGLRAIQEYSNGLKNGVCVFFYHNGQIYKKESFKSGLRDGFVYVWDEDGKLKVKILFENGKEIKVYKQTNEVEVFE